MRTLILALSVEIIKVVKSKVFLSTILFSIFVSFMMGLLFFVIKNPEIAQSSVILKAKTSFTGNADWKTFFSTMNLMIAILGVFGFGFITSWVFGREYSDKTLKDLLSLPVSRKNIVLAKFIVIYLWSFIISFLLLVFSIIAGFIVGLEGWSSLSLTLFLKTYFMVTLMNILLSPVISFLASFGRGYILPLGFIFLILLLSNFIINISENAKYFPWAIPLLYAGATLKEGIEVNIISYIILLLTGILGLLATLYWWQFVDQY